MTTTNKTESAIYYLTEAGRLAKWEHGDGKGAEIRQAIREAAEIAAQLWNEAEDFIRSRMDDIWQDQDRKYWNDDNLPPAHIIRQESEAAARFLASTALKAESEAEKSALDKARDYMTGYWREYLGDTSSPMREMIERRLAPNA